jgi:hypothetical protein
MELFNQNIDPRQQRQHFVPRTYLKRFANKKSKLSVVDLLSGNKFSSGLNKICIEKGINDLSSFVAQTNSRVPADLSEHLYSKAESQYDLLMRKSIDLHQLPSTDEDFQTLGVFTIYQMHRTPRYRSLIQNTVNDIFPDDAEFSTISFALSVKSIGTHKILDNAIFSVYKAVGSTKFISSDSPAGGWLVDGNFWTMFHPPTVSEFWLSRLKIIMPLSPKYLLTIDPYMEEARQYVAHDASDTEVDFFNKKIEATASRFIFI